MGFGICNCSFSLSLPLPASHVRNLRFVSPLRWIQHAIIEFPGKSLVSVVESDIRCHSGEFEPESLAFRSDSRFNESSSGNLMPNNDATVDSSSLDFLENTEQTNKSTRSPGDGDLVRLRGEDDLCKRGSRGGKQMMKRSNLVAKQVISIQSALVLGFISQLWVDTTSWLVEVVEVKPSLLSGESDRFLLKDIVQVGDIVLVEDEIVLENELKITGLETLVGYRVVTPGRRRIGKVRSYTFNISSGIIESLELDSFGISIIPSSLVSTYILHVEDIIEVLPDVVVIHEAAASRIQRLTKGLWDAQPVGEYSDIEQLERSDRRRRRRRDGNRNRYGRNKRDDDDDDWGLFY